MNGSNQSHRKDGAKGSWLGTTLEDLAYRKEFWVSSYVVLEGRTRIKYKIDAAEATGR